MTRPNQIDKLPRSIWVMNSSPIWNERRRSVPTREKRLEPQGKTKPRNLTQEPIDEMMGGLLPSKSKKIHDRFLSVPWPMHKNHLGIFFFPCFSYQHFKIIGLVFPFNPQVCSLLYTHCFTLAPFLRSIQSTSTGDKMSWNHTT